MNNAIKYYFQFSNNSHCATDTIIDLFKMYIIEYRAEILSI